MSFDKIHEYEIHEKLKEISTLYDIRKEDDVDNFTALEISNKLGIQRNVASHYLNNLIKEGKVIKINTRPVYFIDKQALMDKYNIYVEKCEFDKIEEIFIEKKPSNEADTFTQLIGYNKSLKYQIKQCISAAAYPPDGLPVLLTGPTGTGKSYMAQLVYEYAIATGQISNDAPFNIFNCAQYVNNPELLSANLFGYVKGAFTGADTDKPGIIEKSNDGYLFLDEVHCLNPEGQEKLFIFMDKSIYRRMGESNGWRKAKVRFIFATTEKIEEKLINTFLRRIPIIINLPDLNHRGESEKLELIYFFFHEESYNIKKNISLSYQTITTLLKHNFKGNIGDLKNIVKYICANSYTNQNKDDEIIKVNLNYIPNEIIGNSLNSNDLLQCKIPKEGVTIKPSDPIRKVNFYQHDNYNFVKDIYLKVLDIFEEYEENKISLDELISQSTSSVIYYFDKIIFHNENNLINDIRFDMVKNVLSNIMNFMKNNYGLKYYGNTVMALCYYLYNRFFDDPFDIYDVKVSEKTGNRFIEFLKKQFPREFGVTTKLLKLIESSLDVKFTIEDTLILTFYTKLINMNFTVNEIHAIIIAHGYSTASSISNVVNRLIGHHIFESFDMPIEVDTKEIIIKLEEYINNIDTTNGLIILVDMGSLEQIYTYLECKSKGVIGIINNMTTLMALEIGEKIIQNFDIKTIIEEATKNNISKYKLVLPKVDRQESGRQKAIITTCVTGIGTAIKIKDLLTESLCEVKNIKVLACDYVRLKSNRYADVLFNEYEVIAIVGTADPGIKESQYIALEDIISGKGADKLYEVFNKIIDSKDIKKLNMNIVKVFSLERVINTLTILNPDKIINHIEDVIKELQEKLKIQFENDLIISLYIHMSCLIERLVTKSPIESYNCLEDFTQSHKKFIDTVLESCSELENVYSVTIPISEIGYIHDLLSLKIKDF